MNFNDFLKECKNAGAEILPTQEEYANQVHADEFDYDTLDTDDMQDEADRHAQTCTCGEYWVNVLSIRAPKGRTIQMNRCFKHKRLWKLGEHLCSEGLWWQDYVRQYADWQKQY